MVEACLRALPDILSGKQAPTDVMFPNSSMALVEGIYKNNVLADSFNGILADSIVAYLRARKDHKPIRILEIGAGTGGTTYMVLKKLTEWSKTANRDRIEEYCYTDISKAFLIHAETEYACEHPFLTTQIFDVENLVEEQQVEANHYDLVIASNVLHATRNIRQTLRNTKGVLRKNGLIVLNEMAANTLFSHMTFGLLEGWWLYEDTALRMEGCPGLLPETWEEVLEDEGFNSAFYPAKEDRKFGQQIIVSESDGIVRQKKHMQAGPVCD